MIPKIGLSEESIEKTIKLLEVVLSDEMTLYVKTRKFHWNVTGQSFMEFHKLFEAHYSELEQLIDNVAERIGKLGGKTIGTMIEFSSLTRIKEHPIRFGAGNMTAVTGVFEGTFTKPMPIGNGKFIQPTAKAFKMPMATIGIWGADGTVIEEHLFWDNQTYMNQIGLGK